MVQLVPPLISAFSSPPGLCRACQKGKLTSPQVYDLRHGNAVFFLGDFRSRTSHRRRYPSPVCSHDRRLPFMDMEQQLFCRFPVYGIRK
jgi:hypothetical protein